MAEMTIRLVTDPESGKKNIIVKLRSDEDLLPHEHEQMHRQLTEKLVEGGLAKASEVGQLVVEREESEQQSGELPQREEESQRESLGEGA